jgi:hypothetical protein
MIHDVQLPSFLTPEERISNTFQLQRTTNIDAFLLFIILPLVEERLTITLEIRHIFRNKMEFGSKWDTTLISEEVQKILETYNSASFRNIRYASFNSQVKYDIKTLILQNQNILLVVWIAGDLLTC